MQHKSAEKMEREQSERQAIVKSAIDSLSSKSLHLSRGELAKAIAQIIKEDAENKRQQLELFSLSSQSQTVGEQAKFFACLLAIDPVAESYEYEHLHVETYPPDVLFWCDRCYLVLDKLEKTAPVITDYNVLQRKIDDLHKK